MGAAGTTSVEPAPQHEMFEEPDVTRKVVMIVLNPNVYFDKSKCEEQKRETKKRVARVTSGGKVTHSGAGVRVRTRFWREKTRPDV
jgi:hypothetical protein